MGHTCTFVLAFCICLPYTSAESQLDLQAFTLVHEIPISSEHTNFSESVYYKAIGPMIPKINSNDTSIHFVTCLATENKHVCNVTRLTYLFENGTIEDNCINIQLTSSKNIHAVPLSTNSIFLWLYKFMGNNEFEMQLSFMNLDSCKVFDLHYTPNISPVVFNDRVDVFRNSSYECGNLDSCRVSYDYNGKLIGKPTPFIIWPKTMLTPIDPLSPDQGYVARLWNGSSLTTMHLNAVGEASFRLEERGSDLLYRILPTISTAHGVHSSCWRLDDSIRCQQIYNRKLILNRTLCDIPWTSPIDLLSVHSLTKGAILLAIVNCDEEDRCTTMRLRIVKSEQTERENHRWLVVRGIDFKFQQAYANEIQLIENSDRYCLALACELTFQSKSMLHLNYRKWCLPKWHVAVLDPTSAGISP